MSVSREWVVGKHKAHLEEPDLLIVKMGGHAGLEDAKGLTEIYRELGTRQPFFAIVDVTNSPADAEARSYFTKQVKLEWFRASIYVGAGVVEKAITKAMTVAFYFTSKAKTEILYAGTMEEARALVDKVRVKQSSP